MRSVDLTESSCAHICYEYYNLCHLQMWNVSEFVAIKILLGFPTDMSHARRNQARTASSDRDVCI